ncbi:hypothetical protein [Actinocorallia lasiicapitis]
MTISTRAFIAESRRQRAARPCRRAPLFELVIGYIDGTPIGMAFGYGLTTPAWWEDLEPVVELPADFADEPADGARTFAFNELAVDLDWQGRGIAHALHDELLSGRPEERATLPARENNTVMTAIPRPGEPSEPQGRP